MKKLLKALILLFFFGCATVEDPKPDIKQKAPCSIGEQECDEPILPEK